MIGIIPAAGAGERIQPLGCSKELLPVGSRLVSGVERPKAVSEYLVERMIAAGATQICMIISAEKTDIVKYYAERDYAAEIFYVVQQQPLGLCDALFRAEPFARQHDQVLIGLPDTIWFPENAYAPALAPNGAECNLVLFPVANPSVFDAVICDDLGYVQEVQVKKPNRWLTLDLGSRDGARRSVPSFASAVGIAASNGQLSGRAAERFHRRRQSGTGQVYGRELYGRGNAGRLSQRPGFSAGKRSSAARRLAAEHEQRIEKLGAGFQNVANIAVNFGAIPAGLIDQIRPLLGIFIQVGLGQQVRGLHDGLNGIAEIVRERS